MIGLCTDSAAQLPPDLIERYGIEVVPLTICVNDQEYLEGVDLDPDDFYGMFSPGYSPIVATSQPSPGQIALAYEQLAARGATEILSVHIGSSLSGTMNAARLAARLSPVPVRLVDSGTASFGVGCCVWSAAEAIAHGASVDEAAAIADSMAPAIGNVFIVGALDLLRAGGRVGELDLVEGGEGGLPVLTLREQQVAVVARASTADEAAAAMANEALSWGNDLCVAVGVADVDGMPIGESVVDLVRAAPNVREIVRYRIGPSIGAHTGPGTAAAFFFSMNGHSLSSS